MLSLSDVRTWASQRLARQRRAWIDGGGTWPLVRGLEPPNAIDIRGGLDAVTRWTSTWTAHREPDGVRVVREARVMRGIGSQTMPVRIEFDSPRAVAEFAGEVGAWDRVVQRRALLVQLWPQLAAVAGLGRLYEWLHEASDLDVERLAAVVAWVVANPRSGLYLRQLPVAGVDTKWIEGGQRRAIATLVGLLNGNAAVSGDTERDFLRMCGLRAAATRIRVMVLDPELRRAVGGVRDIQAPPSDLRAIPWAPGITLFLENLACAHSLPDLQSTVAVVGLGRAVSLAAELPWIHRSRTLYWGDIDTDGLEILSLARALFPDLRSILMDSRTLHRYRQRWVPEGVANGQADRARLLPDERALYEALLANKWEGWDGDRGVRLEQERLDWPHVEEELRLAVGKSPLPESAPAVESRYSPGCDQGGTNPAQMPPSATTDTVTPWVARRP